MTVSLASNRENELCLFGNSMGNSMVVFRIRKSVFPARFRRPALTPLARSMKSINHIREFQLQASNFYQVKISTAVAICPSSMSFLKQTGAI